MDKNRKIKIIKIIDETAFIINAGSDDGIEPNDQFNIIDSEGEQIFDPETNELLGMLNTSKGKIIADEVYPKMTITKTRRIAHRSTSPLTENLAIITNNYKRILGENSYDPVHYEELNVDQDQITGGLNQSNHPIKVGDEVSKL